MLCCCCDELWVKLQTHKQSFLHASNGSIPRWFSQRQQSMTSLNYACKKLKLLVQDRVTWRHLQPCQLTSPTPPVPP